MTQFNLFPMAIRRRQLLRRRTPQWTVVCLLTLFACGGMAWSHWAACGEDLAEVERLERKHGPFAKMRGEIDEIRGRMDDLKTQERLGLELADKRSMTSLMGLLSKTARDCDRNISVQRLTLARSRREPKEGRSVAANTLSIEGVATSHIEVARFMTILTDAKMFNNVKLTRSAPHTVGDVNGRSYQLECSY